VIFAPNAAAAAAEMVRVSAPTGRILLSAWVPEGAIHEAVSLAQEAVRRAVGAPAGSPPFAWHDRDALAELFAPYGFEVAVQDERLAFTANSPREYVDAESANHPLAVASRAVLERQRRGPSGARQHALDLRSGQRGSGRLPPSRAATSWPRRDTGRRPASTDREGCSPALGTRPTSRESCPLCSYVINVSPGATHGTLEMDEAQKATVLASLTAPSGEPENQKQAARSQLKFEAISTSA